MSRVIFTIALAFLLKVALAQQEPNFSQYMYNQIDYNPGSAGYKDMISLSALGRQQWLGFPGKPTVSVFSVNAPVKPLKINSGIGLVFQNDNIGYNKDINVKFAYAYRMVINETGKLGIGISGGFRNKVFKPDYWLTADGGSGTDPNIPTNESGTAFDMGFGLFYNAEDLYLGLSVANLLQSPVKYKSAVYNNNRHYFLTAGYNLPLKNSFELQPSVMLMSDGMITSADINTVLMYNNRFWGGVSYRINSSFVGMVGIELMSGLRVGYSYDVATTDMVKNSNGTHELMIGYNFVLGREKIPHKNKSVRFL